VRGHNVFSPSKLTYLSLCPSFVSDERDTKASLRGESIHEEVIGLFMSNTFEHSEENINWCLSELKKIKTNFSEAQWFAERELKTGIAFVSGYADIVGVDLFEDVGVVIELKTGYSDRPEAEANIQLKAYCLALLREVSRVFGYILELDRRKITQEVFSKSEKLRLESEILNIIRKALEGEKYQIGEHCKLCERSFVCPSLDREFERVKEFKERIEEIRNLPAPVVSDKLNRYWDMMKLLEAYWQKLKDRAIEIIESGETIEGFELKKTSSQRKWIDQSRALKRFQELGLDVVPFLELKSPSVIEKELKTKGAKKKEIDSLFDGLIEFGERKQLIKKGG